ncbi:MAG TPA: hypothetical protein VFO71_12655 [Gemmatimonadales bacterium]|nr:hypothetical protein [Gemmatimonadales bacterium]
MKVAAILLLALLPACRTSEPRWEHVDPDPQAYQILAGSQRALGATDWVQTISALALVAGPHGSFETRVHSARDGRARLDLGGQFLAGVGACHGWLVDDSAGMVRPLDGVSRSVVRGHELHMLVVAPETRWRKPRSRGTESWAGKPALAVEFRDDLGKPALLYLRQSDTLPVGLKLVNHTGHGAADVTVSFSEWKKVSGVRLFRRAVFEHGGNRYVYDYTQLKVNAMLDTLFEPPRQLARASDSHR